MTRASDLAKLLGAGATINDGTTITTDDNTAQLELVSTDADSGIGPHQVFYRNSSSPADADLLCELDFRGRNDNNQDVDYSTINVKANDVTDGEEDGEFILQVMTAGSTDTTMHIKPTEIVFNEDSIDRDFRVESDGQTHAIFLQASNGNIGINESSPDATFDINGTNTTNGTIALVDENKGNRRSHIHYGSNGDWYIRSSTASGFVTLQDANTGTVYMGKTNSSSSVEGVRFSSSSQHHITMNGGQVILFNRGTDDGSIIGLAQADSTEGNITVSGSTISYNAFSASHWSRFTDNSKPTILKGTVIETIDEMMDWYQLTFTVPAEDDTPEHSPKISTALKDGQSVGDKVTYNHEGIDYQATIIQEDDNKHTKCKISDTADSTRVYGVFADWDNDDDTVNDMYVTAVGTHVVRINKDVTVSAGDLLSSNGDGTAKVQDDDIIRSKTIGKVLTNIKQETYDDGSYTVPCALYCG